MSNVGRRLLLVDDDEQLVGLLDIHLAKAGYNVTATHDAELGARLALSGSYDIIILDVLMPRITGTEICSLLRNRGVLTPVLMLSGQADKDQIVRGLNGGADDYLTKPFNDHELFARLRALLRRNRRAFPSLSLERFGLVLDIPTRTLRYGDESIVMTRKETLLFRRLMAEAPEPVARLALLQDVWGIGDSNASNRLDVYIRRLRRKLQEIGCQSKILTLRSSGYYFSDSAAARTRG